MNAKKTTDQFVPASELPGNIAKVKPYDLLRIKKYSDFDDVEWAYALAVAKAMGLDPLMGQVEFYRPLSSEMKKADVVIRPTLGGMRAIAHRSGEYVGMDMPHFEYAGAGLLKSAEVTVWRRIPNVTQLYGWTGFVRYEEWAAYLDGDERDGQPHRWLGELAELMALQQAFPIGEGVKNG
jgi:hypothetical protein